MSNDNNYISTNKIEVVFFNINGSSSSVTISNPEAAIIVPISVKRARVVIPVEEADKIIWASLPSSSKVIDYRIRVGDSQNQAGRLIEDWVSSVSFYLGTGI